MNKGELISKVAESTGISKVQASAAVNTVLDSIRETLQKGDSVTLIGFGTFSVSTRAARIGRNPQTGESVQIAAKSNVKFKPGKDLTSSLN